ncbi:MULTISPECIES: MFS transporter [Paenibacillus]|uniref:MFS transporter n=1 Tax=Paenibacillus alvei TaxID=44250 RepID=A0ABT4E578_PAEAL|nr:MULTISPECIES: MFS transporter [Paenibacillus]EPY09612.1 transporter, major facilitator family protein [Paenibacillus alvei A6-6i-x]MCM3288683.1 MFS transporter [Paenibacillus sp. MER 180]MCY9528760.1 MFS transporter [Paenibacillus alvei]OBY76943.1 MFS transporter [Paenibacillus sp. KS1]SDG36872.1 Predicted arabinose efflux permease, MFS family [Paenibacillus sp. cl6col]
MTHAQSGNVQSGENKSVFSLFRNRFVQAIMVAGLFMQIGVWVRNFAVLLFVMEMTNGDPFAVSMVSVAEFAPIFIFSFIGGTFADRWRPKRTMIWCDFLSALSVFAVMWTIVLGDWHAVFFTTFISAILSQFSQPSSMKLFKQHVPEEMLQAGMSIFQTMVALFMVLGPAIGTTIFQHYGIQVSLVITGIAFILSAVALLFLPADHAEDKEKHKQTNVAQELAAGFRYVMKSRLLKPLGGCFAFAGLAIGLIQPMGAFLVTERLGLPKENLSYLVMVNGGAMLIGGALAMGISKKLLPQHMLAVGMLMSSGGMLMAGLSTQLWLTLVAQFISGLFLPCIQIGINTMILQNTEGDFIGRVNGILSPMFTGAMVLTMSLSGGIKQLTSIVFIYEVATVLFILGILVMLPILLTRKPSPNDSLQRTTGTEG